MANAWFAVLATTVEVPDVEAKVEKKAKATRNNAPTGTWARNAGGTKACCYCGMVFPVSRSGQPLRKERAHKLPVKARADELLAYGQLETIGTHSLCPACHKNFTYADDLNLQSEMFDALASLAALVPRWHGSSSKVFTAVAWRSAELQEIVERTQPHERDDLRTKERKVQEVAEAAKAALSQVELACAGIADAPSLNTGSRFDMSMPRALTRLRQACAELRDRVTASAAQLEAVKWMKGIAQK